MLIIMSLKNSDVRPVYFLPKNARQYTHKSQVHFFTGLHESSVFSKLTSQLPVCYYGFCINNIYSIYPQQLVL
jgi:hypothetical protein